MDEPLFSLFYLANAELYCRIKYVQKYIPEGNRCRRLLEHFVQISLVRRQTS